MFDTDDLPQNERFAFYREVVSAGPYKMTPEYAPVDAPAEFRVRLKILEVADAISVLAHGTPHANGRTRRDIAAAASDCYYIFEQIGSPVLFQGEREELLTVAPGDLVLGDADCPFATPSHGAFHHRFWLLPKSTLDPVMPGAAAMLARPVHLTGGGVRALLSSYLATLHDQAQQPDIADNPALIANLAHLLGIALGAARPSEPQRAALADARRARAQRHIEREFWDPELSAAAVARLVGISVRTLHADFEPTGISFTERLASRRLQAARAALANRGARGQSIAAIAFACGFNDVGTFHRAFRRAYGTTPSDLRR